MPEHADMPLETSQRAAFMLACPVARGIAYLSDPAVVLSALPSTERIIQRQRGAYRIMLAPMHLLGVSLRPAAEITFATSDSQVVIQSIAEAPYDLQPDEVIARVTGRFVLRPTESGCTAQASLRIAATIPARFLPSMVPRIIIQRTTDAMLILRIKQETQMMTRALVRGYAAWEHAE